MSTLECLYVVTGIVLGCVSLFTAFDRTHTQRVRATLFWAINATLFMVGSWLPSFISGLLVIVMVSLVAFKGGIGRSQRAMIGQPRRERRAIQYKRRLFVPMIIIPIVTLAGTAIFKLSDHMGHSLLDPHNATLAALALGIGLAFLASLWALKTSPISVMREGTRLYDAVGWTLILPQTLAALGAVFAKAGVGGPVAELLHHLLPLNVGWVAVLTYCIGMALLAFVMGNALAAFPIMTIGVGIPFVVQQCGGNPAIMASLGMLCGFCGGLMTPMAANFNTVPATLLHLSDVHAVIRVQRPTAIAMLIINTLLMMWLVY